MNANRLIPVLLTGGLITYLTYQSKYQTFFFESLIWTTLLLFCLVLLVWVFIMERKMYRSSGQLTSFSATALAMAFILVVAVIHYRIRHNFDKPSLIKVYYNGDYNGTAIDFKTDGTYLFDNSAIGMSDYQYGTYQINGDQIILDRKQLDRVIVTNTLQIRDRESYTNGNTKEKYLYQINNSGQVIPDATEFRLVVDNRK